MTTAERYLFTMVNEGAYQDEQKRIEEAEEEAERIRIASLPVDSWDRVRQRFDAAEKRLEARYNKPVYVGYIGFSHDGICLDGTFTPEQVKEIAEEYVAALVGAGA